MDLGHIFQDTESVALSWGTNGIWLTTTEAIASTNATSAAHGTPWDVTHHTYRRSVAATRFALSAAYLFVDLRRSITNPDQVRGFDFGEASTVCCPVATCTIPPLLSKHTPLIITTIELTRPPPTHTHTHSARS